MRDANGNIVPGPNWSDTPFLKLRRHRSEEKRVSEFIQSTMLNTWGNGTIAGLNIFGNKVYFICKPDDFKAVLTGNHMDFPKATRYDRIKFILAEGLLTSSGKIWQLHRRMMNKGFGAANFDKFLKVFLEKTKELLSVWRDEAVEEIDFSEELNLLTHSIICKAGFGYDINFKEQYSEPFGPDSVAAILHEANLRLTQPFDNYHLLFPSRTRKVNDTISRANQLILRIVERRLRESKEQHIDTSKAPEDVRDLLEVLLKARDDEGTEFSAVEMRDHIFTFLAAGTETTGTTISWSILELCRQPAMMKRCIEEVDNLHLRDGNGFTSEDASRVPYLTAVIKESLRLYPPATLVARTCKRTVKLGGYDVPQGSNLMCQFIRCTTTQNIGLTRNNSSRSAFSMLLPCLIPIASTL